MEKYIKDICKFLEIEPPKISYVDKFDTATMMAQCCSDGNEIRLKKVNTPNPDYMFAIAHELRHIWQIQSNCDRYFNTYKQVSACKSVEEYNLQLAEVDANAFAAIIMIDKFHLQPQWNGLSNAVVSAIEDRMYEI